jgi:hypothetical protein
MADLICQYLGFWVGFQLGPSDKGLYMAFVSSENPQKEPLNTQIPLPRSMIERGRIGIPGNFMVLKVIIAEVSEGGNGSG